MRFLSKLLFVAIALIPAASLNAEPAKGKGPGHGGMPDQFRDVIHSLFAAHDSFTRSIDLTEKGYRARTISQEPKKAALLQEHVAQMESRLEDGRGVRQWDPAFAELRRHYRDMKVAIEKIDGGVAVEVTGKTTEAIAVARNHAKIISGFIKDGAERMHATHAAVLAETSTKTAAPACGSCGKGECQGNCGKGKGSGKSAGGVEKAKPCCESKNPAAKTSSPSSQ